MPDKNIPLLKRLRTRFLRMRHAKHFDMGDVVQKNECGAAMCIAGHALDLAGYKWKYDADCDWYEWFAPDGTQTSDPLGEASELLGLSYEEAEHEDEDGRVRKNGLFYRYDIKTPKRAAVEIEKIIQAASA